MQHLSTFRQLATGQTFDWIGESITMNSFYLSCIKTGPRTYTDENGTSHRVGSINAVVYHINKYDPHKFSI